MSHNLNFNEATGKYSFAAAEKGGWHGLGQVKLEGLMTSEEALELAQLNYRVEKMPLFFESPDKDKIYINDKFAVVRTDAYIPLGVVGSYYNVLQNEEAFSILDDIVGEGKAVYDTAGALKDGQIVFITIKLPGEIQVKDDKVEKYLLFTNSHDGSKALTVGFTPIRVVCNNTLHAALSTMRNSVTVKHTKNIRSRVEEAARILGLANIYMDDLGIVLNKAARKPIMDNELRKYFIDVLTEDNNRKEQVKEEEFSTRFKNILEKIERYYFEDVTQEGIVGTWYGAYNAVTGYYRHCINKQGEELVNTLFYGDAKRKIEKAYSIMEKNVLV